MAGKGAPKGNKYAAKARKREGMSVSIYLDAYTLELLQAGCQIEGQEPTVARARKRALALAKAAIGDDVRRIFAHPDLEKVIQLPPSLRKS